MGTGKPLAGIGIGGAGLSTSRTDDAGRYELTGCPKAREYYLVAGGYDGRHIQMFTAVADTAGLGPLAAPDIELPRGIPFHGKVIDKASGKPVTGGEVWYFALWPNPDAIKYTPSLRYGQFGGALLEEDGTFTCPVLPGPGAVVVRLNGDHGYLPACVDPQAFFKDKLGDAARLTGDRDKLNLVGSIPAYTPRPSPYMQEEFPAITLINPDKDTEEIKREIALERAHRLKVAVLGADGKPLAGAKVRGAKQPWDWETLRGADFTITGPNPHRARPRTVLVVHEASRQIGTLVVKGDETGPLEVRLRPWGTVTGRLLSADGEPCAGSIVDPIAADRSLAYPPSMQLKTDKDGTFRIEGMMPGVKYQLRYAHVSPDGSIEGNGMGNIAEGVTLKAGETRDLGNVTGRPLRNR
jgi:hypothetical protein